MFDAVVIGAGIFGSVITRALRKAGLSVCTVDAGKANAGSAPAACLMKPSWFTALGKEVYDPALKQLEDLIGIEDVTFKVPAGYVNVHWCNPKKVLLHASEVTHDKVLAVQVNFNGGWATLLQTKRAFLASPLVIVAAGIWTSLLFPEVKVVGQAGAAWLWPEAHIIEPKVRVWAPYKQLVAFNRGDGLWVGDGTSVRTWSKAYQEASLARSRAFVAEEAQPTMLMGYRPYVAGASPCMLKQVKKGLWIATGGAKNGTLAAGWCADQLLRAL